MHKDSKSTLLLTSKAFFIFPLSWLTDAERASGLIRDAASPAFQWFSNDQRELLGA
jgi:hypothetical protein